MAIGNNMTQREQLSVGAGVLAILAAVAFWYFLYAPKRQELAVQSAHVDSVEASNRQARVDLRLGTVQQLQRQAAQYEQNLELMRELVPASNEVPALLEDVSTAARRVGLDIGTVEPMPVIPGEQFDTYRYKIGVIGGYHEIGEFLTNVGSLGRIVAPVRVELKAHTDITPRPGAAPRPADKPLLDANLVVQTYVARNAPSGVNKEGGE